MLLNLGGGFYNPGFEIKDRVVFSSSPPIGKNYEGEILRSFVICLDYNLTRVEALMTHNLHSFKIHLLQLVKTVDMLQQLALSKVLFSFVSRLRFDSGGSFENPGFELEDGVVPSSPPIGKDCEKPLLEHEEMLNGRGNTAGAGDQKATAL